jgi:methionine--tRNA ligase beta chain
MVYTRNLIIYDVLMELKPNITYEDFAKLDLRVATVKMASRLEGSDKLLRLEIALADEEHRQIIAGIGAYYQPEDIVGRQIVIIANLEPRKLMGLMSEGMLLAAEGLTGAIVLSPEQPVAPGAIIK